MTSLQVNNLLMANNTNLKSTNEFSYMFFQEQLGDLNITGVEYESNQLSGRIFNFQSRVAPKRNGTIPLYLSGINIQGNQDGSDLSFLYFLPLDEATSSRNCLDLLEAYSLEIDGLKIWKNRFAKKESNLWSYRVALFQVTQTQVSIKNAIIASNSFERYDVVSLDQKHSSVTLKSNLFDDNVFVSSSLINTRYQEISEFCSPSQEKSGSSTLLLYRYSFILNNDFINTQLHSSVLFNLNNVFLLLKGNEFLDTLLIDSSVVSTSLYHIALLPGTTRYSRNSSLESLVFKNKEENWELFNQTISQLVSREEQTIYFYALEGNKFENLTVVGSPFLVSLTGYNFEQSLIKISGNSFLEAEYSEELSTMIYIESFASLKINENIFSGVSGGVVLFSMPQAKESVLLQINSNQVSKCKIAGFSTYSGKIIQSVEVSNNTLKSVIFYMSFLSVRSEISSGLWNMSNNVFTQSSLYAKSDLTRSETFTLVSFWSRIAYAKAQVVIQNNTFDWMNLGSLSDSTEDLKTNFISVSCPQNAILLENKIANFTFYSQGALIDVKGMQGFAIEDSTFDTINANNLNGLIVISAQQTFVARDTFNAITNKEGKGIFSFRNNALNQMIQILGTSFDKIEADLEGAILSVKALESEVISGSASITIEISDSKIMNILSGSVIQLNTVNCSSCTLKDTYFDISSSSGAKKNAISIIGGSIGSLDIVNAAFAKDSSLSSPFVRISNSIFQVSFEGIQIDGNGVDEFYLATIDSGTIYMVDSVFENIVLNETSFISLVPNRETLKHYVDEARYYPNVVLGNNTFRNISNANRRAYWNDAEVTLLLTMKMFDLLPNHEFLRRLLDSQYDMSAGSVFSPAIVYSAIPFGFLSQDCVFESLSLLPGILLGSAAGWDLNFRTGQSQLKISGTAFKDCEYFAGPAINVLPKAVFSRITIEDSTFENNNAYVGGALSIYTPHLQVSKSRFLNNHATLGGAAIFTGGLTASRLKLVEVYFDNNTAFYAGNVKSGATELKLEFIPNKYSGIQVQQVKDTIGYKLVLSNASTEEVQSGQMGFRFVDPEGEDAPYFGTCSKVNIEIGTNSWYGLQRYFTFSTRPVDFSFALLSHEHVKIGGKAHESIHLNFEFVCWNMQRSKSVDVKLRACVPGEYNNTVNCETCPFSTYTFDPNQRCTDCPENAHCTSRHEIVPHAGYWNANVSSALILPCRNDDLQRCTHGDMTRSCAAGYTGPMCEACDFEKSYVEHGYLKCSVCSDPKKSLLYTIVLGVLYFAYQLFSIHAVYQVNKESRLERSSFLTARKIEKSYYIKSLLTYTQLMSILFLGNSYIYQLFGIVPQIGNPASLVVYGTQCTLKALGVEPSNFLYYQTYMIVFSPVIQLTAILMILVIAKVFYKRIPVGRFFVTACVYYLISYQPGLVLNLMQYLSCSSLKDLGYSYVTAHPNWTCDSSEYRFLERFIVAPALIGWCVVIPILLFMVLLAKRNRKQEQSEDEMETSASFGMLFFDLKDKHNYWGLLLMMVKLGLSFLIFGFDKHVELQICISLMLLWAYQSLVKMFSPYKNESFNRMEVLLMNLFLFNIVTTKYLLNPSNGPQISGGALILTIILNGFYLIGVLWKIISLSFISLVASVEKNILNRDISLDHRLLHDSNHTL